MKNNIGKVVLFSILFIAAGSDFAQSRIFINSGLKFGYAFGENGGFIFGESDQWFTGVLTAHRYIMVQ